MLVEDEGEYPTIGYFSEENEKFVSRSVVIINQALALRDGANNVKSKGQRQTSRRQNIFVMIASCAQSLVPRTRTRSCWNRGP